jgi:chaperonin GroEL
MQDLALLTGGTVISEETGMKLDEVTPDQLGRCKKVEIDKNNTVVLGGSGDAAGIQERCELIRHSIETTKSDYEREKLQERLAKLSGGVAIIRVGGASEVEVGEKKDRVVDALNATRAAVEEGIVPGGGKALLYCSTKLDELKDSAANMDQKIGIDIIKKALKAPLSTIVANAGEEGAVVCGELTKEGVPIEQGYDAQNAIYTDMFAAGIIDPTKVTRTGIVDAASVASLLTTSESMIVDKPQEGPVGPPGGMGGMGGMPGMM